MLQKSSLQAAIAQEVRSFAFGRTRGTFGIILFFRDLTTCVLPTQPGHWWRLEEALEAEGMRKSTDYLHSPVFRLGGGGVEGGGRALIKDLVTEAKTLGWW